MKPLQGVTVLALEHVIAAPLATRHLADLGARVIKIERPGAGDQARGYDTRARGLSSHFVWTNRGKESVALDLKHPAAREVLQRLVARADVLVQNLAPGAAARLGLSHAALNDAHPRLIVCDISGYGDDPQRPGPWRDKKAYDLLIQAEAGVLSVTGTPEAPAKAGVPLADIAAGMNAYSGILAALLQRGRTGRGVRLDISMLEATAEWMGFPLHYAMDGAPPPPRAGAAHATIAPYGPFPTGDGGTVMLGLQNEREWQAFCAVVLQQPDLAHDPRFASNPQRVAAREALQSVIAQAFAPLTAAQVIERLEAAGIANARVNTMAEVWAHPQLHARQRLASVDSPVARLPAWRLPGWPHDDEPTLGAVPAVGQHTHAVLAELGYGDDQRRALSQAGALGPGAGGPARAR
jgi:itaconate CoA-transferase